MTVSTVPVFSSDTPDPNTQGASEFSTSAALWTSYQASSLVPGINTAISEFNLEIGIVNGFAADAEASAVDAAASAVESEESAEMAQSTANFKGLWATATGAADVPSVYSHNGLDWQLLNYLPNIAMSEPGVSSDWEAVYKFKSIANEIADPLCHLLATNQPVVKSPQNLIFSRPTTQTYTDRYGVTQSAGIDLLREEKDGFLSADGVDESISIPSNNTIPNLTSDFSIIITANNIISNTTGKLRYLWQIPVNETITPTRGLFVTKEESGASALARFDDGIISVTIGFNVSEMSTIAIVKNDTEIKAYCNGVLVGSKSLGAAELTLDINKNVKIGGRLIDSSNNANCNLKNFKTFDFALTPSQILALS